MTSAPTGRHRTSCESDVRLFSTRRDAIAFATMMTLALIGIPYFSSEYFLSGIMIPLLVFALAALGLNILTGYAGQVSFGTAAFMAIGAFASYNIILRVEGIPSLFAFVLGGLCAALVGIAFGLPSLRIRGFYLAASTLATQFFIVWCLTKIGWLTNYSSSGVITSQKVSPLGFVLDTPPRKYVFVLLVVATMVLIARNLIRSNIGRSWIAIRDMDVAAEVIGVRPLHAKLTAFAVSSFYCGIAGALYAFAYIGTVEPEGFGLDLSFRILFMIIIGGMGSILGSFLGAAFIVVLPIGLNMVLGLVQHFGWFRLRAGMASTFELMIFGALIIFFLAVEPLGLARLLENAKQRILTRLSTTK